MVTNIRGVFKKQPNSLYKSVTGYGNMHRSVLPSGKCGHVIDLCRETITEPMLTTGCQSQLNEAIDPGHPA